MLSFKCTIRNVFQFMMFNILILSNLIQFIPHFQMVKFKVDSFNYLFEFTFSSWRCLHIWDCTSKIQGKFLGFAKFFHILWNLFHMGGILLLYMESIVIYCSYCSYYTDHYYDIFTRISILVSWSKSSWKCQVNTRYVH